MTSGDRMSVLPSEFPELDENDPRRYRMTMDWVWSDVHNRGLRKQATVRATVTAPDHEGLLRRVDAWTTQLHGPSDDDTFVSGGWFCQRESVDGALVLLFGSGGQDVAESLDYGIQRFSGAVLKDIPDATVTWTELPLTL